MNFRNSGRTISRALLRTFLPAVRQKSASHAKTYRPPRDRGRDLTRASADYQRAGFTVTPGGEHTSGGTHNALLAFADGTYFELIAFKEPDRPQAHRWWSRHARVEGLIDFALGAEHLRPCDVVVGGTGVAPERNGLLPLEATHGARVRITR